MFNKHPTPDVLSFGDFIISAHEDGGMMFDLVLEKDGIPDEESENRFMDRGSWNEDIPTTESLIQNEYGYDNNSFEIMKYSITEQIYTFCTINNLDALLCMGQFIENFGATIYFRFKVLKQNYLPNIFFHIPEKAKEEITNN